MKSTDARDISILLHEHSVISRAGVAPIWSGTYPFSVHSPNTREMARSIEGGYCGVKYGDRRSDVIVRSGIGVGVRVWVFKLLVNEVVD